jgi:hypothetical protein
MIITRLFRNNIKIFIANSLKYLSYTILSIIINDALWRVYGQFITCVYIWQMSYHIFVACAFIYIYLLWNYPFTSGTPTAGVSVAPLTTVIKMYIYYDKSTCNKNVNFILSDDNTWHLICSRISRYYVKWLFISSFKWRTRSVENDIRRSFYE